MKFLAILLLASVPLTLGPKRTPVDMIEHNVVYDAKDGKPKFSQVILWEKLPDENKFVVREWYMLTDMNSIGIPYKTAGGQWEALLPNRKGQVKVYSDLYRETETPYDPERRDQKVLDPKFRLLLPKGELK